MYSTNVQSGTRKVKLQFKSERYFVLCEFTILPDIEGEVKVTFVMLFKVVLFIWLIYKHTSKEIPTSTSYLKGRLRYSSDCMWVLNFPSLNIFTSSSTPQQKILAIVKGG